MNQPKKSFWSLCFSNKRDRRYQNQIVAWGFAWSFTWVFATKSLLSGWLPAGAPRLGLILLATGFGAGMVWAYLRFLRATDELRRKIEIDALALAAGVAMIGGVSYRLLKMAGFVSGMEPMDIVILLMSGTYMIAVLLGFRRYT